MVSKKKKTLRAEIDKVAVRRVESNLEVEVTMHNDEPRPLFATVGVRQIQFDEATGTLHVWFSDHGRDPGAQTGRCRADTVPRTRTIDQGTTITFSARLPQTYTRLVPHEDETFHFETIDLRNVQNIVAHVALSETPFYLNPKGGPMRRQLVQWGEGREATVTLGKDSA